MAEYRRFVAYFYEYIDGKRQRNAGFVKAQRQGEIWKLQLQLKAGRWPEGQMPVYGYEGKEDSFPAFFLGMGYGKRDSFQASLEYRQEEAAEEEKRTENLQGMWIPLDSRRSYISHWLEGEIDPEKLFLPEREPEAEQPETPKREQEAEKPETPDRESKPRLPETPAQEPDGSPSETPEPGQPGETEEPAPTLTLQELYREMNGHRQQQEEPQERLTAIQKLRADFQEQADLPGEGAVKTPKPEEKQKLPPKAEEWETIRRTRQLARPFEGLNAECAVICPGDAARLGRRGWPVGKNSFLLQGFIRYRHLLLGRMEDGDFLLGVPGRESGEDERAAAAFGFPEFLKGSSKETGEQEFGYWCRRFRL